MTLKLPYHNLSQNILDFCAVLRLQGFSIGPEESHDALRVLALINIADYSQFRDALQMVLCASREQEALFDVLFRAYFLPQAKKLIPPEAQSKATDGEGDDENQDSPQARKKQQSNPKTSLVATGAELGDVQDIDDDDADGGGARSLQAFFSPFGRQHDAPLDVSQDDMDAYLDAASSLVNRLRLGRSRRWRAMPHGGRIHFRRTMRQSLQTGGDAMHPAFLGHPLRKPRFVLLLDGSRSMSNYSDRLLQFAHALALRSPRVEVFLFSTELKRVTRSLRRGGPGRAPRLNDLGEAWGGGTRIGDSLASFNRSHGMNLLNRDTLVLIASDGLDTGKAEVLARAMREIHRRSASVVWLNPLLSTKDYEPIAAGMQAALPYIDTFSTVHDLESLQMLAKQVRLKR